MEVGLGGFAIAKEAAPVIGTEKGRLVIMRGGGKDEPGHRVKHRKTCSGILTNFQSFR
jgi:hypothetical protein